jgi:hypothetical protein
VSSARRWATACRPSLDPSRRNPLDGPDDRSFLDLDYVGVKAPHFSFTRLEGADPTLGVEMASTGEVACLGEDVHEAYLKAILATGFVLPKKNILLSIGGEDSKGRFLGAAQTLAGIGYRIYATDKTSAFLKANGVPYETHFYPGTLHGFHNNSTPRYHEAAARLAWDRTLAHFRRHLAS